MNFSIQLVVVFGFMLVVANCKPPIIFDKLKNSKDSKDSGSIGSTPTTVGKPKGLATKKFSKKSRSKKSTYLGEAKKVQKIAIETIKKADPSGTEKGLLQHGLFVSAAPFGAGDPFPDFVADSGDKVKNIRRNYESGNMIDWNCDRQIPFSTDSFGYVPEFSFANNELFCPVPGNLPKPDTPQKDCGYFVGTECAYRPYSSSHAVLQKDILPILFNAYAFSPPQVGYLLNWSDRIDKANTVLTVIDGNTNGKPNSFVSGNDLFTCDLLSPGLNNPWTLEELVDENPRSPYFCKVDCQPENPPTGRCEGTTPKGSFGGGSQLPWDDKPYQALPFVDPQGFPQAWVGDDGKGWVNMFIDNENIATNPSGKDTNLFLDPSNYAGVLDRQCPFVRNQGTEPLTGNNDDVYKAWRKSVIAFQTTIEEKYNTKGGEEAIRKLSPTQVSGGLPNDETFGLFVETEITVDFGKLKKPPVDRYFGAPDDLRGPRLDRNPAKALGDDLLAVTVSARTCADYYGNNVGNIDADQMCNFPYWSGTYTSPNINEKEQIEDMTRTACYLSGQFSKDTDRFVPVLQIVALSNIIVPGNVAQWDDPFWKIVENWFPEPFDCCQYADIDKWYTEQGLRIKPIIPPCP